MKKNRLKKVIAVILVVVNIFCLSGISSFAVSKNDNLTMAVKSGCYIYTKNVATSTYRAAYLCFGQNVSVISRGSEWTTIKYGGSMRYIKTANIDYISYTVIKSGVLVSKGAYAASGSNNLGYVHYSDKVTYLETVSDSNGNKYVHCIIPKTFNSNGSVKSKNVSGYIKSANVSESSTLKIINAGSNVYSYGYGSGSTSAQKKAAAYLNSGTIVESLTSNDAWAKIKYNGKIYFISPKRLSSYKLQILTKSTKQTASADPNGKVLHYLYWNSSFTVLNIYESKSYGTFYYCKISGDYGFVRLKSGSGTVYVGHNTQMYTTAKTTVYKEANSSSGTVMTLNTDTAVTVGYSNSTWSQVSYNGKSGYVSTKKLVYRKCALDGSTYSTAYKLYKNNADGKLKDTVFVSAINEKYGYAYIIASNGSKYWVKSASLKDIKSNKYMYTSGTEVLLHRSADAKSEFISVPYMTKVEVYSTVTSPTGSWTTVMYDGTKYYIWQDKGETLLTEKQSTFTYKSDNEMVQKALDKAMSLYKLPTTYYQGNAAQGTKDSNGKYRFDCSGFVTYVLENAMKDYVPTYELYSKADELYNADVIYNNGLNGEFSAVSVSISSIKPGDILFFDMKDDVDGEKGSGCDHCGIYLGNGEFIHSTRSFNKGLYIMPLSGAYKECLIRIKRFIPDKAVSANKTGYTTSLTTKVYPQKSLDGTPADVLSAEIPVTILFTDEHWAYVQYSGTKKGFILLQFISYSVDNSNQNKYVKATSLKLYKSNSTSSEYVEVPIGTKVTYNGQYANSNFHKVTYNSKQYYIYAPNGVSDIFTDNIDALLAGGTKKTVKAGVNMRSAMDSGNSANIIRMLKTGETVFVIAVSKSGAWSYVRTSANEYGYVSSEKLS